VVSVGVETLKVDTEEEASMEDTEAVEETSLKVAIEAVALI
jgi:hypothetical protein